MYTRRPHACLCLTLALRRPFLCVRFALRLVGSLLCQVVLVLISLRRGGRCSLVALQLRRSGDGRRVDVGSEQRVDVVLRSSLRLLDLTTGGERGRRCRRLGSYGRRALLVLVADLGGIGLGDVPVHLRCLSEAVEQPDAPQGSWRGARSPLGRDLARSARVLACWAEPRRPRRLFDRPPPRARPQDAQTTRGGSF